MRALPLRVFRSKSAFSGFVAAIPAVLLWTIFAVNRVADAGQIQNLPSQQSLPQPLQTPPPLEQQPGGTLSKPPIVPGPQGNTREIPLPQVFHGCWAGEVPRVDSIEPLSPDAGHIAWLTKSYTLCYKQTGYSGRWQLTFAEGAVSDRREVSDQRQSIRVKSVSGPEQAQLTAYLHFRAPQLNIFGQPTGSINTLDELTSLDCLVVSGGGAMQVRAQVFVEMDDEPYARIIWHTRLMRAASDH
jgi:hypothetical protein